LRFPIFYARNFWVAQGSFRTFANDISFLAESCHGLVSDWGFPPSLVVRSPHRSLLSILAASKVEGTVASCCVGYVHTASDSVPPRSLLVSPFLYFYAGPRWFLPHRLTAFGRRFYGAVLAPVRFLRALSCPYPLPFFFSLAADRAMCRILLSQDFGDCQAPFFSVCRSCRFVLTVLPPVFSSQLPETGLRRAAVRSGVVGMPAPSPLRRCFRLFSAGFHRLFPLLRPSWSFFPGTESRFLRTTESQLLLFLSGSLFCRRFFFLFCFPVSVEGEVTLKTRFPNFHSRIDPYDFFLLP